MGAVVKRSEAIRSADSSAGPRTYPISNEDVYSQSGTVVKRSEAIHSQSPKSYQKRNSYVTNFLNDADSFFRSVDNDVNGETRFNAADFFAERQKQADSLKKQASIVSQYLDQYGDSYSQKDYDFLREYLSTFDADVDKYLGYYQPSIDARSGMAAYEDEYRAYQEEQARKGQRMQIAAGILGNDPAASGIFAPAAGFLNMLGDAVSGADPRGITDKWTDQQRYILGTLQMENPSEAQEYARSVNRGEDPYQLALDAEKEEQTLLSMDLDALKKEIEELENQYWNYDYDASSFRGRMAADPELRRMEKEISDKQQLYNRAKHLQDGVAMAAVTGNADFGEKSGYVSTAQNFPTAYGDYRIDYNDPVYEYINNTDGVREQVGATNKALANKGYDLLTEEEVGIYNYYYATEGKEKAEAYLGNLEETLNQRKGAQMFQRMQGNTGQELLFGIPAGLNQFGEGISNLLNTKDEYIAPSRYQFAAGMVRDDLSDVGVRLPEFLGGGSLGQVGFDMINTSANMAPSIMASMAVGMLNPVAGKIAGTALMGASAAGSAYQEALNSGYSKEQARMYSALVGGSEAGMEYLLGGISSLGGVIPDGLMSKILSGVDNAFARAAIDLGSSMVSEGFEEGLQEVLTPWFKNLTLMADEKVNWNDVAYSTLLGALSVLPMEGPGAVRNSLRGRGQLLGASASMDMEAGRVPEPVYSKNGKARQISTDTDVDVLDFDSVNNGKATIQLKNGGTAEYRDVMFATEQQANQFRAVVSLPGIDTESANNALHAVMDAKAGADVDSLIGIRDAYGKGYGIAQESDLAKGDSANINPQLRKTLFDIGRAQRDAQAKVVPTTRKPSTAPSKGYKKVVLEGKDTKIKPGTKQDAEVRFMDYIAENFSGTTVHVYKSKKGRDGKFYYWDSEGKRHRAPNGKYSGGEIWVDLNSGDKGEGLVLNTFAHEMYHHVKKWSPQKANELGEFIVKELGLESAENAVAEQIKKARKAGLSESYFVSQGMTQEQAANRVEQNAWEDFIADSLETVFTRGDAAKAIADLKAENRGLFDEIRKFVDKWVSKLKKFYSDKTISKEGDMVAQLESFQQIQKLFMDAMEDAGKNFSVAEVTDEKSTTPEGDAKYQARNPDSFTDAEIQTIQGIGRKSINSFTSRDLQAVEKFAKQYLKEMGTKSPFFRVWFGDWRASETTPIAIANKMDHSRGVKKNEDTGWEINVSGQVFNETSKHRSKSNREAVAFLPYINDIVQKAVLLDSYGIDPNKPKSPNSLLMHSLYAIADIGNGPEVLKLYVEEMNNPAGSDTNKRAYELQNIEKAFNASVRVQGNALSSLTNTQNAIKNVADLVAAVKRYDANYVPVDSSDIRNADGTPKVMYHGSPAQFSRFDRKKAKSSGLYGRGFYFTDSDSHAKTYGNTYSVYLNIRNPLQYGTASVSRDQVRSFLEAVAENEDYSIENYGTYDIDSILKTVMDGKSKVDAFKVIQDISATAIGDMVEAAELFNQINGTSFDGIVVPTETVAFRPEQIKSATDNIGTFDPQNDDIYYSLRNEDAKTSAALEKENAKLREDVGYLKQLLKIQRSVTGGTKFTPNSVLSRAGILMKNNGAKGDRRELAALLNPVYEYIAKGEELTWEGIAEKAKPAVKWIQEHVVEQKQVNEYANDILREIRTSRVYLDESQQAEAAYQYGSYNDFRKAMMGKFIIAKDSSQSLDSRWHELAEMYPGVFDENISASEMPSALADIVSTMQDMRFEKAYSTQLDESDVLRQVYDGYWQVSTLKTFADVKEKEINRLKFNHRKRMDALKESHKSRVVQLQMAKKQSDSALREYKAEQRAKQEEMIQDYRALRKELTGTESDMAIIEREFIRLAKQYEKLDTKSGKTAVKNAQAIADLRAALRAEAASHKTDSKVWEREFNRLLRDYETSGRKIERLEATIQRQRDTASARVQGRRNTELRHKIQRKANELNNLLINGTKHRNIPEYLQPAVAEILNAINMEVRDGEQRRKTYEANLLRYDQQIAAETDPAKISDLIEKRNEYAAKGDQFANRVAKLKEAYKKIQEDKIPGLEIDEGLSGKLDELFKKVGDTPLGQMTSAQLDAVNDVLNITKATISNANKLFREGQRANVEENSQTVMAEVRSAGGEHKKGIPVVNAAREFWFNNLKPVFAFEAIGSNTLTDLFKGVRQGEDTLARDLAEAKEFYRKQWDKHHGKNWDMEKKYRFESTSGNTFELDLNQIMSLYALSKRDQARGHLRKGGFAFERGYKTKEELKVLGMTLATTMESTDASAYNLSDEILGDIIGKLSADQKAFVDEMQNYLSNNMAAKGNEVSLRKYGIRLFKDQNYFPLRVADQYMAKKREQQAGDRKLKNSGFTKDTVPEASNPVVLGGFTDVWAEHVDEMSLYHSFVLPLDDLERVLNYHNQFTEEGPAQSVMEAIRNAYGEGASKYIDQLIRDINGGARADGMAKYVNQTLSKVKKAQTMASLSVAIQQPSSILRATSMIDGKYFIGPKVTEANHKYTWAELKKYAPLAIIKEMGGFDVNVGQSTMDYLTDTTEYTGILEKAEGLLKDSNYRDDVMGRLPALMDELSWGAIWQAVKREQKDLHPNMDVKSEAFLKMCGKRFEDIIVHTQVYDSVFSRSGMMRSKDTGIKALTSYMAEPTTTANMLYSALLQAKRGGSKAQVGRTAAALAGALVVNSASVALVYAMRDDDEDKRFDEKWVENFRENVLEGLNPLGYLPVLRDLNSMAKGFDIKRMDMALYGDVVDAIRSLPDEDKTPWQKVEAVTGAVGNLLGVPVKNILRDGKGIFNTISIALDDTSKDRSTRTGYRMALTGKNLNNGEQLLLAIQSGDEAHWTRVAERFDSLEDAVGALKTAIGNHYKDGSITDEEATELLMTYADMEADDVYWKFEEWSHARDKGNTENYSKFGALHQAIENGENIETEINRYVEHGTDIATIRSDISRVYKKQYLAAEADRGAIRDKVTAAYMAAGLDEEEIREKFRDWDFEAEYGMSYSEFKGGYLDDTVSERELREAMKFYGRKNYQIESDIRNMNEDKEFRARFDMSLSKMKDAYDDGDISRNQLIAALEFTGKTRDEARQEVAERDIENRLGIDYMELDDAYKHGDISRTTLYNAMREHGTTVEEADEAIAGYDWLKKHVKQHPDLTISDGKKFAVSLGSNAEGYTLEDYGVSISAYKTYKAKLPDCKGVDANGDGKTDSGTKRDSIFRMIDSLPISDEAKDGLALMSYSMNSIRKNAPWH